KELTATMFVDDRPVSSGLVDLPAYGHTVKRFFHIFRNDPSGLHHISVAIERDALPEDDIRHLRVEEQRHLRVLLLDGDPRPLRRDDEGFYLEMALHPGERPGTSGGEDAPFTLTTTTLDAELPALADFDAVFLCNAKAQELGRRQIDKALREYVNQGGGL